jgi:predicted RNA-binding protein YlqC (UPF0109 family)
VSDTNSAPTAAAVLEYLVKALVEDSDAVTVTAVDKDGKLELDVSVAPGEVGRVIGKRGRTAQAIRTVTRAAAAKDGVELNIEFLD